MQAKLALEDGRIFTGKAFGAEGERTGEVVFNTSMMGYQEILTDPSYAGQILMMTYPLIGNVGVNEEDCESDRPWVEGFVVRELSRIPSNFRASGSLEDYLEKHDIIGLQGIDTRALTRHIRQQGAMIGVLSTVDPDDGSLIEKARNAPRLVGRDLVGEVTAARSYDWVEGFASDFSPCSRPQEGCNGRFRVVAMDLGTKRNILRHLVEAGCSVTVVPASATADEILALNPDGIFLSNGPGDPEAVGYAVETIRKLVGKKPIFGICMGHELLALALGGGIVKLKFGHRGGNQPVMDVASGRIDITSQNHGFAVDGGSLDPDVVEVTHINLNDQTCEGLRVKNLPVFSVQHHPESSPGPHDAAHHFGTFAKMLAGECRWW